MKARRSLLLGLGTLLAVIWTLAAGMHASLVRYKDNVDAVDTAHERNLSQRLRRELVASLCGDGRSAIARRAEMCLLSPARLCYSCAALLEPSTGAVVGRSKQQLKSHFTLFLCFSSFLPFLVYIHIESIKSLLKV